MISSNKFKKTLLEYYNSVIFKSFKSKKKAREFSAKSILELFKLNKFYLGGTENLPKKKGFIIIYNHLLNHNKYLLKDDFQITLDSHFISSVISFNYYKNPGIRVIRHSLKNEFNHKLYYNNFGYIRVYSKNFLPNNINERKFKKNISQFYKKATEVLKRRNNLIFNPEGVSSTTENSPRKFKAGIFRMAIKSNLDPIFLPVVLSNFDKLNSKTIYRCEIKKPFKLSEKIKDLENKKSLNNFITSLNKKYKRWVKNLAEYEPGFKNELKEIKERIDLNIKKRNTIIFYGSSSLRLWKDLSKDFKNKNAINCGFGGAYIEDCINNFKHLFCNIKINSIVLYVGGNDLNLEYSVNKIISLFKKLLLTIRKDFPNCNIFSITIKPSIHRLEKLNQIKKLNLLMKKELDKLDNAYQINIFDKFINKKGEIKEKYFLVDRLHLSKAGYEIWRKEVFFYLNKVL